jgi:DNA-binding LytR/AlgR family response regulator
MLHIGIVASENTISLDMTRLNLGYNLLWSCNAVVFKHKFTELFEKNEIHLLIIEQNQHIKDVFDLVSSLKNQPLKIIITKGVGYSDEVYKMHPVDVLFTPLDTAVFQEAIERAYAIHSFRKLKAQKRGITVKSNYADVFIDFNHLVYIESQDDYCIFHLFGKIPIKSLMRLKQLVQLLPYPDFIQIHRSFIVSLHKIESIRNRTVFMGVMQFPVSQTFEKELLNAYSRLYY